MHPIFAELHWPTIGLRAGVVAGALVIWFWTQSLIARKSAGVGIGDGIHDLTAGWNLWFSRNVRAANAALITSSLFIDLMGLSLIGAAIFFLRSQLVRNGRLLLQRQFFLRRSLHKEGVHRLVYKGVQIVIDTVWLGHRLFRLAYALSL